MRKLKTIFVASVVVASLYAAAGTAWARNESGQRGTAWTDAGTATSWSDPSRASFDFGF